jgi:hypothetical protein
LRFTWNINGQNIPEPSQKNKILVAPTEGGSKTSNLGLTVENLGKLFQTRTQGFEITSN